MREFAVPSISEAFGASKKDGAHSKAATTFSVIYINSSTNLCRELCANEVLETACQKIHQRH